MTLLDGQVPEWRSRVAADRLDIAHPTDCALGQVFGDYQAGKTALDLSTEQAEEYGFLAYDQDDEEALTAAWQSLLELAASV